MTSDSAGTWQFRVLENGEKWEASLGQLETFRPSDRFGQAVLAAQAALAQRNSAAAPLPPVATPPATSHVVPAEETPASYTVGDACRAYVQKTLEARGTDAAADLEARYRRWVQQSAIETVQMTALSREQVKTFRQQLSAKPARTNYSGGTRPRAKSTVNRDIAALRAALNFALEEGHAATDTAWKTPLKAAGNATQRRRLYLDREQRRALIQAADRAIGLFLTCMAMIPLRPGAMAALDVDDYDVRLRALNIGKDKGGHSRTIVLPAEIEPVLLASIGTKRPHEPLFSRQDGARWNKDSWKTPIKEAARKAYLPDGTTAYTIRHSVITDLVHGGLDLLTVAQISGTSVAMIEKHYGHLRGDIAVSALARLAL
ncbi:tyrosine-type recombinase/integrase [Duganella vulcania]|uniref:Tyrosine-type recombinase/integrase n=1 Tax=Duganella vulcania TaxID=2692166 RepID=A0A845GSB4_9BURK|nr:site-specific integrase [Duganella vulcania]MYM96098.1 tyrosine-type recombinase/integrase [Duganella vulcania]